MRLILATAMVLASGTAFASSITTINGAHPSSTSIVKKSCADCAAFTPKTRTSTYKVPQLEPGTQRTDIVEINGEKKIVRTEAWLGGSPVIYVSKLPAWMADQKPVAALHPKGNISTENELSKTSAASDGVDVEAKTGALKPELKAAPGITQAAVAPAPLAIDGFQLRTN